MLERLLSMRVREGSALIEILIVLGIVAFLAAITVPYFSKNKKTTLVSAVQSLNELIVFAHSQSNLRGILYRITFSFVRPVTAFCEYEDQHQNQQEFKPAGKNYIRVDQDLVLPVVFPEEFIVKKTVIGTDQSEVSDRKELSCLIRFDGVIEPVEIFMELANGDSYKLFSQPLKSNFQVIKHHGS